MKKKLSGILASLVPVLLLAGDPTGLAELDAQFNRACREDTPMHEHVPVLRSLAARCSTVVEIGVYDMVSTWGILRGLAENRSSTRSYVGIDIRRPLDSVLNATHAIAADQGIAFQFIQGNDMDIDIEPAELLFIDSLHTYAHLSYELEKFSPKISRFIAMHDTSDPWGSQDEDGYTGDYSEYPPEIDRTKRGLWNAVVDFLDKHPEWELYDRRTNCFGFTVLKRK